MGDLQLRDATLADVAFVSDVSTLVRPSAPSDPAVLRYEWEHPQDSWVLRRFIALAGDRPAGWGLYAHPRWDKAPRRFGMMGAELLPELRDCASLASLIRGIEELLVAAGARTTEISANEDDPVRIASIAALGYRKDRRSKRWELDLVANRVRLIAMAEESRARMRAAGVRLLTLADDPDPLRHEKIWRMSSEADEDVPSTLPHVEETLDDYLRWFAQPDMRADRIWLAREGDAVVGISVLRYPPVRGVVGTAWTATARGVRGRGIARAVKCETIVQAIALGVDRVRTGNDAQNDPILHINASMGYRPIAGRISYLKDA